jgi:hypothetical protein
MLSTIIESVRRLQRSGPASLPIRRTFSRPSSAHGGSGAGEGVGIGLGEGVSDGVADGDGDLAAVGEGSGSKLGSGIDHPPPGSSGAKIDASVSYAWYPTAWTVP